MAKLEEIAGFAVKKTGIFHNQPNYYKNKMKRPAKIAEGIDKQVQDTYLAGANHDQGSGSVFSPVTGCGETQANW